MIKVDEAQEQQRALLIILVAILLGSFLCYIIYELFPHPPANSAALIIDAYREYIAPKPREKFVFLIMAATVPSLLLLATAISARTGRDWIGNRFQSVGHWLPALFAVLFFTPLPGSSFAASILGQYPELTVQGWLSILASLAMGVAYCVLIGSGAADQRSIRSRDPSIGWEAVIALIALLLQLLSWRVIGFNSVSRDDVFATHMDPVMYALSQVAAGKTILVDLPSQYGLFPEMLAPILKPFGVTVLSMTVTFALMQLASMVIVFVTASNFISLRSLRLLFGVALIVVTFESVLMYAGIDERYFQYWPIRFFWPAISLGVFAWFCRRKSYKRSLVFSFVAVAGALWNIDSGLFVGLAFGAFLVARAVLALCRAKVSNPKQEWSAQCYALATIMLIAVVGLGVVAFLSWMSWKSGSSLRFNDLFEYQKIFYDLGLMMIPLPMSFDPWMSVIGVYLVGLLVPLRRWMRGRFNLRDDLIFYLAMLGLGLFVYYEGRSHVLNLITVCWPALIIVVLLADEQLRAVRLGLLPRRQIWVPIAVVSFLMLTLISYAWHIPAMARSLRERVADLHQVREAFVHEELKLIERHSKPGDECLVLARRQGIYSAEAGLASPYRGPGIVEILLKSEQVRLVRSFLQGKYVCVFLGVGGYSDAGLKLDMTEVLRRYRIVDATPGRSMLFLQPRD